GWSFGSIGGSRSGSMGGTVGVRDRATPGLARTGTPPAGRQRRSRPAFTGRARRRGRRPVVRPSGSAAGAGSAFAAGFAEPGPGFLGGAGPSARKSAPAHFGAAAAAGAGITTGPY